MPIPLSQSTRRRFLKHALVSSAVPYFCWDNQALANNSSNDRPQIGCIGVGDIATRVDCPEHSEFADIRVVCDVDSRHAERAKQDPRIGKGKADTCTDYRRVLERKDIDAVAICTPDHWHVKIAIEALQAGKHVFCQKPLTLTLAENQLIRAACRKYDHLVFAVGTQRRSERDLFLRAVNMVQKGLLGDIRQIKVGLGSCPTGGPFGVQTPPAELDWDTWLGPAPATEYLEQRCHYNFRWWYEYSGGKFTDWGAHFVDTATWAIQHDQQSMGPVEIDGSDCHHPVPFEEGYPTEKHSYNTSTDFSVSCRFATGTEMILSSRVDEGILFEGSKGRIFVGLGKIAGKPIEENWDEGHYELADVMRLHKGKPFESHKANFYRCIREGGLPVSDVFSHVQMLNTCHLSAIAARLGRTIKWDPVREEIVGDDQAASFFSRQPRRGFELPSI